MKRALALLLLSPGACDGIGLPIIDQASVGITVPTCSPAGVDCGQTLLQVTPLAPPEPTRFDGSCGPIESACGPGWQSAPMLEACSLEAGVVGSLPTRLPPMRCVPMSVRSATGDDLIQLADLHAEDTTIELRADVPTRVVLARARLESVRLLLYGPITLEVREQSVLERVWIEPDRAQDIELYESRLQDSVVLAGEGRFRLTRGRLFSSQLFAEQVELETTSVLDSSIKAARMTAIELGGKQLRLDVDDVAMAALDVEQLSVFRCVSGLIASSRVRESYLGPCSQGMKLDDVALSRSSLYGDIEGHTLQVDSSVIGANARASVVLEGSSMVRTLLCNGAEHVALGFGSGASCTRCDELPAPEQKVCGFGETPEPLARPDAGPAGQPDAGDAGARVGRNPLCPVLDAPLPMCDPPPSYFYPL